MDTESNDGNAGILHDNWRKTQKNAEARRTQSLAEIFQNSFVILDLEADVAFPVPIMNDRTSKKRSWTTIKSGFKVKTMNRDIQQFCCILTC